MGCTSSLPLQTPDETQPMQVMGSPIPDYAYLSSAFSSCEMALNNNDEMELTDYCSEDSEAIIERYEGWLFASRNIKPSPLTSITEVTDVDDEPAQDCISINGRKQTEAKSPGSIGSDDNQVPITPNEEQNPH
ncbi:hypothetical protein P9112_006347 [Eukaryota sp. TZLM1-RC]